MRFLGGAGVILVGLVLAFSGIAVMTNFRHVSKTMADWQNRAQDRDLRLAKRISRVGNPDSGLPEPDQNAARLGSVFIGACMTLMGLVLVGGELIHLWRS